MKILYHHRTRSLDGQRVHINGLIGGLRRAGHTVLEVGPAVREDDSPSRPSTPSPWLRPLRELAEIAYNIIEIAELWRAARRFEPHALYSRHALYCFAPRVVARLCGLPWVTEVNAPLAHERSKHGGLFFQRLAFWLETATLNAADRVIVVTRVMGQFLTRQGVREERLEVHPNGIDTTLLERDDRTGELRRSLQLNGATVLGFVGFVRDWNRLDRTYPYLVQNQEAVFVVVGDGPDRPRLESEASRAGVDGRVRFLGAVAADAVLDHARLFDVAMIPEATVYASPLKLLDYLAAGCAILAPDRDNLREVLEPDRNALLFDPDSDRDFEEKLARLLDSAQLRQDLGRAARETIDRLGLTWDHNADRVVELFSSLGAPR